MRGLIAFRERYPKFLRGVVVDNADEGSVDARRDGDGKLDVECRRRRYDLAKGPHLGGGPHDGGRYEQERGHALVDEGAHLAADEPRVRIHDVHR